MNTRTRTADSEWRDDILRAARGVFQERGLEEARMAEIAKHAGIAANPRYITFPPKAVESQKQTGRGQKQGPFVPATINDRLASN